MNESIRHPHPLIIQGQALRDKLLLSGDHRDTLRKLNDLVDKAYLNPAEAEKLKNLIRDAQQ